MSASRPGTTGRAKTPHDTYLILLQEKNKMMKQLKEKDSSQINREKQEQGFSLYVNGPHVRGRDARFKVKEKKSPAPKKFSPAPPKSEPQVARRGWNMKGVEIKMKDGTSMMSHAPSKITGEYEEDFERALSTDEEQIDSEDQVEEFVNDQQTSGEEDENNEIEDDTEEEDDDDDDDEPLNKSAVRIGLNFSDVTALRQSLEDSAGLKEVLSSVEKQLRQADKKEKSRSTGTRLHSEDSEDIEDLSENSASPSNKMISSVSPKDEVVEDLVGNEGQDQMQAPHKPLLVLEFDLSNEGKGNPSPDKKKRPQDFNLATVTSQISHMSKEQQASLLLALRSVEDQGKTSKKAPSRNIPHTHDPFPPPDSSFFSEDPHVASTPKNKIVKQLDNFNDISVVDFDERSEENNDHQDETIVAPSPNPRGGGGLLRDATFVQDQSVPIKASPSPKFKKPKQLSPNPVRKSPPKQEVPLSSAKRPGTPPTVQMVQALPSLQGEGEGEGAGDYERCRTAVVEPRTYSATKKNPFNSSPTLTVTLQLFSSWSTWGDDNIGLTEVQFLNDEDRILALSPSNVCVQGQEDATGECGKLVNGKFKTTSSQHMWHYTMATPPVVLKFVLPSAFPLKKIRVWNYNRANCTTMGAKEIKIFVNDRLIYEGELRQGNGTKSHDWSQTFIYNPAEKSSTRPTFDPFQPLHTQVQYMTQNEEAFNPLRRSSSMEFKYIEDDNACETPLNKSLSQNDLREILNESKQSSSSFSHKKSPERGISVGNQPSIKSRYSKPSSTSYLDDEVFSNQKNRSILGSQHLRGSSASESRTPIIPSPRRLGSNPSKDLLSSPPSTNAPSPSRPLNLADRSHSKSMSNVSESDHVPTPPLTKPLWLQDRPRSEDRQRPEEAKDPFGLLSRRPVESSRGRPSSREVSVASYLNTEDIRPPSNNNNTRLDSRGRDRGDLSGPPRDVGSGGPRVSVAAFKPPSRPQVVPTHPPSSFSRPPLFSEIDDPLDSLLVFKSIQAGRIGNNAFEENVSKNNSSMNRSDGGFDINESSLRTPTSKNANPPFPLEGNSSGGVRGADLSHSEGLEPSPHDFMIANLPRGTHMVIDISSTWGDPHYVGLTGIEVLDIDGERVSGSCVIVADPADLNVLPGTKGDPRVVKNLLDGVNRTRDDTHMWLAPFCRGTSHLVSLTFASPKTIALMRFWNYNESRIHSCRGAKDVSITLDSELIFRGEIKQASGTVDPLDEGSCAELILFTTDETILARVAAKDRTMIEEEQLVRASVIASYDTELEEEDRPLTGDTAYLRAMGRGGLEGADDQAHLENPLLSSFAHGVLCAQGIYGQIITLNLISTWGDLYYVGLTGIEVISTGGSIVPLTLGNLAAMPRDLNDLDPDAGDDRTLDKLVDGVNATSDDSHMWLIPFTQGEGHYLQIDLGRRTHVLGLRVWNYNKSHDDSFRGAKHVHVYVDGEPVADHAFLFRQAPGTSRHDFAQSIFFGLSDASSSSSSLSHSQHIETKEDRKQLDLMFPSYVLSSLPTTLTLCFRLMSTWGDRHYVGLNGIALLDANGNEIPLNASMIFAEPSSVNDLEDHDGMLDPRTPEKLVDGVNDTDDDHHMWLAPFSPSMANLVWLYFDQPVSIACIQFWNYSKTPSRGVCDFQILADERLIYSGMLQSADSLDPGFQKQSVLFSTDHLILEREGRYAVSTLEDEQDVCFIDEHVTKKGAKSDDAYSSQTHTSRPKTSATGRKR